MTDQVFALSSGRRLAYAEFGDPAGVPAFYFHGWPSSRGQGVLMDAAGRRFGLRVICPDRPGMGRSDFQPGRRLLDWPPVLEELASHLGWDRFHLFGVSGGGPYVLAAAHAMPERVLSASVVCGAPPLRELGTGDLFWPYRTVLAVRRVAPWLLGAVFQSGACLTRLAPESLPVRAGLRLLEPADRQALREGANWEIITGTFREALRGEGARALQVDGDIYLSDWGFSLAEIPVEVHFWHGKRDRNIPWTYGQRVARLVPRATTHWTEEDGHYSLPLRRGEEIAARALRLPAAIAIEQ